MLPLFFSPKKGIKGLFLIVPSKKRGKRGVLFLFFLKIPDKILNDPQNTFNIFQNTVKSQKSFLISPTALSKSCKWILDPH